MSKLPFSSTIITHALVETCVFGGITYYLNGRISSLEKRVQELEDILLERLRKDNARLNPRPVPKQPTTPIPDEEPLPQEPLPQEPLPQNPPPLVRQHAVEQPQRPTQTEQPIPIEIEMHVDQLKAIDDEVEKEIAELNLN